MFVLNWDSFCKHTSHKKTKKDLGSIKKKGNGITQIIINMQKTIISLLVKVIKQLPKKLQVVQLRK
jgi:hypothetical protein